MARHCRCSLPGARASRPLVAVERVLRARRPRSQAQGVAKSSAMSRNPKDIAAEALELPLAARAELASQLLESLDDLSEEENDQLWAKEADRRYAEYKAGNIEAISAD